MKSMALKALSLFILLFSLTGCWNSLELTELGFIMGVSMDQEDNGQVELNAQIYSPTETAGGTGGRDKPSYNNIKIVNDSIFDAVRDIPVYLGRKAQWAHLRVILIGEQFAKENDIGDVLDFFYRDHETRFTTLVIITEGKAADYWETKPFIERTIAQQMKIITDHTLKFASKTQSAMLLDIAMQLNSKGKTAIIPFIKPSEDKQKNPSIAGVGILKKGKLIDRLSKEETHLLLMLTNEYRLGVIDFPCMDGKSNKMESIETVNMHTKLTPKIMQHPPTVKMETKISGIIGELRCSSINTKKDVIKLEEHIAKHLEEKLNTFIKDTQEKQVDAIGVWNELYKKDPALWKKYEKDWENIYVDIEFENDVQVQIQSTGMSHGKRVLED